MPSLANCINAVFTPGNIGADSGATPVQPTLGTLEDPDSYDPTAVTYSHDFSKFYNSMIHHHRVR